jgi:serine/threonine-protein kinase HipA
MADDVAQVTLWNRPLGTVAWNTERRCAAFEYTDEWIQSGLEVSPLMMPLNNDIHEFRTLSRDTYRGLPGLLADSLPDRFGNRLINLWLRSQGKTPQEFNSVQRLCYIGERGMGALEFEPVIDRQRELESVEMASIVKMARMVLSDHKSISANLTTQEAKALETLLHIGTSAGGARAKAIIAMNRKTGDIRSGQLKAPDGYEYLLIKFDGVNDTALGDPAGVGRLEYAYYLMAKEAGIDMSECRLHEEGGRAHFVTKRFDRGAGGEKLHVQSWCSISHDDFNPPQTHSYERLFRVAAMMGLPPDAPEKLFRRMVFNVISRNQDDHPKNWAFTMDQKGTWDLSPAYDITYSYNPDSRFIAEHQISLNGKFDGFIRQDFLGLAKTNRVRHPDMIIDQVSSSVNQWRQHAATAGVNHEMTDAVEKGHRTDLMKGLSVPKPKKKIMMNDPAPKKDEEQGFEI